MGLGTGLLLPAFTIRSRRPAAASIILNELRQVDAAKDQYTLETNKPSSSNVVPSWADLTPYLKAGSRLAQNGGNDWDGNPILIGPISGGTRVNPKTKQKFARQTGGDPFWGPYS